MFKRPFFFFFIFLSFFSYFKGSFQRTHFMTDPGGIIFSDVIITPADITVFDPIVQLGPITPPN
jgi:hypothetical protein